MEEFYPEIESLKPAIEAKMGKRLVTPADFTDLVGAIEHDTGVHVGITTVKRLWGYVSNDSRLRDGTLSVFARFVGYRDWTAFREAVREAAGTDSEFLTDRQITASGLAVGDRVELGWQPDRYCLVRHDGGGRFTVEKSVNAKLHPGDTFTASLFCLGRPFYVTDLAQPGGRHASYVAGEKHGLTLVKVVKQPLQTSP